MTGSDAPPEAFPPPESPQWPTGEPPPRSRPSTGGLIFGAGALIVAAVAAFLYCSGTDDKGGSSQGIGLAVQQQQQAPQQQRPVQQQQQPPAQQPQASGADQILNLNMQFTQAVLRNEGTCPGNAPAVGTDLSPRTPTKVTINKTKGTIQLENSDGTKSDVATINPTTGMALITYQGAVDNRSSTVKVTDTTLEGDSSFFPFRGRPGGEQYVNCKVVLRTTAKVV
jgi:hypothetical protein